MLNTAFKEICHLLLHTFYLYKFALFSSTQYRAYLLLFPIFFRYSGVAQKVNITVVGSGYHPGHG